MNRFTSCITVVIFFLITKLKLCYQMECPSRNLHGTETLNIEALAALSAKNTLVELGIKDAILSQPRDLNIVRPAKEVELTASEVDSWIKNSFHSNSEKKNIFGGDNSYLGEITTAESQCAAPPVSCLNDSSTYYFRTYDGSCNNLENPGFGMANSRYSRMLKPKYGDATYSPSKSITGNELPNARVLSLALYGEDTLSDDHLTYMTMQFGQFISHDISKFHSEGLPDDCCSNSGHKMCYPIALHRSDPITMISGKTCLNFARGLSDMDVACPPSGAAYAEKITTTTGFLDLSSVYGNSLEQNIKVRLYKGGLLRTNVFNNKPFLPIHSDECPANNEQCFNIPDNRNQFTPPIAVLHTLFLREHNRLASLLARINPQYTDERLFQVARKINIAQFQKIVYYDWLPLILSPQYTFANHLAFSISPYEYANDYEKNVNPAPLVEYAGAAFRYFHQSIPGWFSMVSPERNSNHTMRLSDYFDRQDTLQLLMNGNNFDSLLRGLATQLQKRLDGNIDREIKHHFNRKPFEEFGTDLKSIDIQRGRDFGMPSYNDLRERCGLPRAFYWSEFLNEISDEKIEILKKFYKSPNDVELNVGGSYETHAPDSTLGPTFQCIIGQQFLKTRKGDRFFFENEGAGFTREQLAEIRKISLASILCANGNNLHCIQPNIFVFPDYENNLVKCKELPQLDLRLWKDNNLY